MKRLYKPSKLLSPFTSPSLQLPNRIIMAPMTRARANPKTGRPSAMIAHYYVQRASAGFIISEGIYPDWRGRGGPGVPGLVTKAHVAAWQSVTTGVHAAGGRIFAQLFDVGRVSHPYILGKGFTVGGPSAVRPTGTIHTPSGVMDMVEPVALTFQEIQARIRAYAKAAENALKAGFDGVEIHAANGYLPHQFLADNTNLRTDKYGENKAQFLLEVVDAVAVKIGAARIGVRISPGNPENDIIETNIARVYKPLLKSLESRDIAYVHVLEKPAFPVIEKVRSWWSGTLIGNINKIGHQPNDAPFSPGEAEELLKAGLADLVAFGRLFIANPDLPLRIATGSELRQPVGNHIYGKSPRGYIDFPAMSVPWQDACRHTVQDSNVVQDASDEQDKNVEQGGADTYKADTYKTKLYRKGREVKHTTHRILNV